jgi:hypothetical protein
MPKKQKHFCASMLNLQSHPVWARINGDAARQAAGGIGFFSLNSNAAVTASWMDEI